MNFVFQPLWRSRLPALEKLLDVLHKSAAVSYILNSHLEFVYCNPAWDKFAEQNGGGEHLLSAGVVGSKLFPVIPSVLQSFYREVFQTVQRSGLVWQHVYECSSAEVFRKFRMRIHPMKEDGFFISNALYVEQPQVARSFTDAAKYRQENGMIFMCAHCRCSQRVGEKDAWDFVPAFIASHPLREKISHGLCPSCRSYFYSGLAQLPLPSADSAPYSES
jgi:hypothetical protein